MHNDRRVIIGRLLLSLETSIPVFLILGYLMKGSLASVSFFLGYLSLLEISLSSAINGVRLWINHVIYINLWHVISHTCPLSRAIERNLCGKWHESQRLRFSLYKSRKHVNGKIFIAPLWNYVNKNSNHRYFYSLSLLQAFCQQYSRGDSNFIETLPYTPYPIIWLIAIWKQYGHDKYKSVLFSKASL